MIKKKKKIFFLQNSVKQGMISQKTNPSARVFPWQSRVMRGKSRFHEGGGTKRRQRGREERRGEAILDEIHNELNFIIENWFLLKVIAFIFLRLLLQIFFRLTAIRLLFIFFLFFSANIPLFSDTFIFRRFVAAFSAWQFFRRCLSSLLTVYKIRWAKLDFFFFFLV